MKTKEKASYSEDSIEVLKGLESVRRKPTMYMGPRGNDMVAQMLKEAVDNALDEALEGRNSSIEVVIDTTKNEYTVVDKAEGIPVGVHKTEKMSTLQVVMTMLHAGGKFGKGYQKGTVGTHGVGISATNALSEQFDVWTYREGWHHQGYQKSKPVTEVRRAKPDPRTLELVKDRANRGTIIRFTPDQKIVSDGDTAAKADPKKVALWLKNTAMLNAGVRITFTLVTKKGAKTAVYHNDEGPLFLLKKRVEELDVTVNGKPFLHESPHLTCAFLSTSCDSDEEMHSYVNSSQTTHGGTHMRGFVNALAKVLSKYKRKNQKIESRDLCVGLVGILNWKMKEPEFKGQTKEELASNVTKDVEGEMTKALDAFFTKNKTMARDIIKKALAIKEGRDQFKKVVQTVSGVNKTKKLLLPGVLTSSPHCSADRRELFIVEGDSAAGTAKKARDSSFQEVFKLTGKSINAIRATIDKLFDNKVIRNLFVAFGIDMNNLNATTLKIDCSQLRVNRVLLLTDADEDGDHISMLVLTVIYKYFPDLIKQGRVYIVDAPLFHAFYKNKHYFGATFQKCHDSMPSGAPKQFIIRSKGWGEIDPDTLSMVAFNPETRGTIKVTWPEAKQDVRRFEQILGQDTNIRKQLLGL